LNKTLFMVKAKSGHPSTSLLDRSMRDGQLQRDIAEQPGLPDGVAARLDASSTMR